MKERGILFSAPMVRALLSGAKTVTRRVVKPRELAKIEAAPHVEPWAFSPYGIPGTDRLWVRETWGYRGAMWRNHRPDEHKVHLVYRADDARRDVIRTGPEWAKGLPKQRPLGDGSTDAQVAAHYDYLTRYWRSWRPGIHMPWWASRITLDVLSIRVERLCEISEEDARAEGVTLDVGCPCHGDAEEPGEHLPLCRFSFDPWPGETPFDEPRPYARAFAALWVSINGRKSWDESPWVWVVSFKRSDVWDGGKPGRKP